MMMEAPLRLVDRLRLCGALWAEANGASVARLGRLVVNDSSFFTRPGPAQGPTTGTLEKFARFLGDAANWPDGLVPEGVSDFVHRVGAPPESAAA